MMPVLVCAAVLHGTALAATSTTAGKSPRKAPTAARADTARVHIGPSSGGTAAFVAWPAGGNPTTALIVVQEWWGLNDQIRQIARRLAGQGYVAIVPDLYHGKVASDPERAHE